jgi:hypothetical protein
VPYSNLEYAGMKGKITFPGGLATELHPLALILLAETEKRGYDIHPGWCWGYNNRPIAGTHIPSNHSRATALDVNAPENGYGSPHPAFPANIAHEVWETCGWEWGGDWDGSGKDGMHLEYIGARSTVKANTDKAKRLFGGTEEDDLTPEQETFLKELMRKLGGTPKGAADRLAAAAKPASPTTPK